MTADSPADDELAGMAREAVGHTSRFGWRGVSPRDLDEALAQLRRRITTRTTPAEDPHAAIDRDAPESDRIEPPQPDADTDADTDTVTDPDDLLARFARAEQSGLFRRPDEEGFRLLLQAREQERKGDLTAAAETYARAAQNQDPEVARAARRFLDRLRGDQD